MEIQNVSFACENVKRYPWARAIVEEWKQDAAYAMEQERSFFEEMISELTLWPEYGQNCPVCVNRLSSMGECGIYEWNIRDPDRLVCMYCKTAYPNPEYPETGRVTAPRMGQTFDFYLTEEERAHPEDRSGKYAFKWSRNPVHTSWSGVIRSKKATWCVHRVPTLARLYGLTGEVAYAERAAWIMDMMAQRYPNWLFHSYDGTVADLPPAEVAVEMGRNPRGGQFQPEAIVSAFEGRHRDGEYATLFNGFWGAGRFGCSGSDGGIILSVTLSYDLIREATYQDGTPVITPEMDRRIREDLILAGCADTENWNDINNKCGRGRALSGAVGILFQRPASVRRAIEGFELLIENDFHFDGFCCESPGYSGMHLGMMRQIPEILMGYSDPEGYTPEKGEPLKDFDPFQAFERYRLALESMVRMLDPRMCYPVIGDSRDGSGLDAEYAEILTAHYGNRYAGLLERALEAPLAEAGSEYALWRRDPDLKVGQDADLPLYSEWFPGWHVAVLRGEHVRDHTAFYFNGYAYGGHRHYDTLGVIYIAHGKEMAADRGYIWDDPRNAWTKSTLSHNIVTVDGVNQNGEGCHSTLELFGRGPGVEVVQASANAYEQCDRYQRMCALVEVPEGLSYVVDFFRVRGGKLHRYGFHCNGKMIRIKGADPAPVEEEIQWLSNLRGATPGDAFTATWEHEGVKMDLTLLNPIDRLLVADAPGWRHDVGSDLHAPPVQQILAERTGGESRYAAVMAPYEGETSPIQSARLVLDDAGSGAMAVAVEREGCTDYILSSPDGAACQCGPVVMAGRFGFASVDAEGKTLRAYLLDGTELVCGEERLELSQGQTPLKVASVEGRTYHLAEDVPGDRALAGTYLLADETGYEIKSAAARTITVRDYPAVECDEVKLLNADVSVSLKD